ncbi:MAG TPA: hypothetical protein VH877_18950 [Polyangia bacterium]|nr:hypothetical protein [Polyangia bacterium]
MKVGSWALGVALLALAACNDTPERVADHFVDFYFVEIDQARARPLTTGLASRKLDDELRLVESIRQTYEPDQAKPSIFYVRQDLTERGERARATYELTIRRGGDESHRQVLVSLERVEGRWKVGNFLIFEGKGEGQPLPGAAPAPSAAPPSPSPAAAAPPAGPGAPPPSAPPAPKPATR